MYRAGKFLRWIGMAAGVLTLREVPNLPNARGDSVSLQYFPRLFRSSMLRSKVNRPGLIGGDVTAGGCADASLYTRFHAAGLTQLRCFPQLVAVTPEFEPSRVASFEQRILSFLTAEETTEWREAVVRAKGEGTFLFALPHHCAVGAKPH